MLIRLSPTSRCGPSRSSAGRLFDLKGRPVPGVALKVHWVCHVAREEGGEPLSPSGLPPGIPGMIFPGWPEPAISDPEGRFVLRGWAAGLQIRIEVDDPRFEVPASP